jgi:hypothetical protein
MARDWDGVETAAGTRPMFWAPRKKGNGDGGGGGGACERRDRGGGGDAKVRDGEAV